jgi:hypothetical protein
MQVIELSCPCSPHSAATAAAVSSFCPFDGNALIAIATKVNAYHVGSFPSTMSNSALIGQVKLLSSTGSNSFGDKEAALSFHTRLLAPPASSRSR